MTRTSPWYALAVAAVLYGTATGTGAACGWAVHRFGFPMPFGHAALLGQLCLLAVGGLSLFLESDPARVRLGGVCLGTLCYALSPRSTPMRFCLPLLAAGFAAPAVAAEVARMAKAAGGKLSMHSLRKGFGCRLAKQPGEGGAAMLHELMRHSSMQVTMDYYANVDDALQDAISRLA